MPCQFCAIAREPQGRNIVWSDAKLVIFTDHRPIRRGHVQIIPRVHYETFEILPDNLASAILQAGQRMARVQKRLYGAARVGFVFTGNEVPHVHAHVLPLFAADDITSARYAEDARRINVTEQEEVAQELRRGLSHE